MYIFCTLPVAIFFIKLLGIDHCEKHNNILGGRAWQHFFTAFSKLEAMAINIVRSANANDVMPLVYTQKRNLICHVILFFQV